MSPRMTVAQAGRDYHAIMRGRLKRLCSECPFKNEPQNCPGKKEKTDCMFYNVIIAETVLTEYHASLLKNISIDAFARSMRVLGYAGTLEKTQTVKI